MAAEFMEKKGKITTFRICVLYPKCVIIIILLQKPILKKANTIHWIFTQHKIIGYRGKSVFKVR